jgi:hypothetical protein
MLPDDCPVDDDPVEVEGVDELDDDDVPRVMPVPEAPLEFIVPEVPAAGEVPATLVLTWPTNACGL